MRLDEREITRISLCFVHISADGSGLEEREFCSQTKPKEKKKKKKELHKNKTSRNVVEENSPDQRRNNESGAGHLHKLVMLKQGSEQVPCYPQLPPPRPSGSPLATSLAGCSRKYLNNRRFRLRFYLQFCPLACVLKAAALNNGPQRSNSSENS
jgi:hypothetical protein